MDGFAASIAEMKAQEQRQWVLSQDNKNAISGLQGEERGIGALLVLIQVLGFVFLRKSTKSGDAS